VTVSTPHCPAPRPSPAFQDWLNTRRLDYAWAAEKLGRSREYIRLICLPFDDPLRRDPSGRLVRDIIKLTEGAVRPDDWHPPVQQILRGEAA
jgi:hypothetical protein